MKDIEQLIEEGGKILSYCYSGPGIAGNKRYPEYRLEEPHYSHLREWYKDVIDLLKEMGENDKVGEIGRLHVTSMSVDKGVLPDNVESICKILIKLKESSEHKRF